METQSATAFGLAYNAAVWAECRRFAPPFLKEAQERLPGDLVPLLQEAAARYQTVSRNLKIVAETYPFSPGIADHAIAADERSRTAVAALQNARDAEAAGLDFLATLVEKMSR